MFIVLSLHRSTYREEEEEERRTIVGNITSLVNKVN